jgi:hypothetical protein
MRKLILLVAAVLAIGFGAGALVANSSHSGPTTTTTAVPPPFVKPFSTQSTIYATVGTPLPLLPSGVKVTFNETITNPSIATLAYIIPAGKKKNTAAIMPLAPGRTTVVLTWGANTKTYTLIVVK